MRLEDRRRLFAQWCVACAIFGVVMTTQETITAPPPFRWDFVFASLSSRLMQAYITGLISIFAWYAARAIRTEVRQLWIKAPLHLLVLAAYSFLCVISVSTARYFVAEEVRVAFSWAEFVVATFRRSVSLLSLVYGIVALAESFHAANEAARQRAVENAELRGRLAEAHLETLRLQLQPHFLFNTLHTASALVDTQPLATRKVLSDLGDLLRASLDRGPEPEVSLRREIELLGRYIDIQRARFGDRLTFEIEAPADCLNLAVPPMMLQPLVENSIRHGLADRPGRGAVRVRCSVSAPTLHISIEDDGVGLKEGVLSEGVGLGNTRARLAGLHGANAGIEIESSPTGGTSVRIRLPARPVTIPRPTPSASTV